MGGLFHYLKTKDTTSGLITRASRGIGIPRKHSKQQVQHALELLKTHTYKEVEAMTGIKKRTLINRKNELEAKQLYETPELRSLFFVDDMGANHIFTGIKVGIYPMYLNPHVTDKPKRKTFQYISESF